MNKKYVSTRSLVKTNASLKEDDFVIVMNYSTPNSIVLPYSPELERGIEELLFDKQAQKYAKSALTEYKEGGTVSSDNLRKELMI